MIHTPSGWMVLQLVDRAAAIRPPLDDRTTARITVKLTERMKEARLAAFSAELWKKYDGRLVVDELDPVAMLQMITSAPDTVVATWEGGRLTAKEAFTTEELRKLAAMRPGRATEELTSTLRATVNTVLVREEARARKIAEISTVAHAVAKREAKLMEEILYAKHVLRSVEVTEAEVRRSYEEQQDRLLIPERRRVAHIAVATEEEASALRERLVGGEQFKDLLVSLTLDETSIKTEGDIGWIEKGEVAEMYDPLFALPLGGFSEPIPSEKAWHIVSVTAIEPEHPLSYEEAKEKLRTSLLEKKKHDARQVWIEKLREASDIKIVERGIKAFVKANPYEGPDTH